jgi:hypothetical protein
VVCAGPRELPRPYHTLWVPVHPIDPGSYGGANLSRRGRARHFRSSASSAASKSAAWRQGSVAMMNLRDVRSQPDWEGGIGDTEAIWGSPSRSARFIGKQLRFEVKRCCRPLVGGPRLTAGGRYQSKWSCH